MLDNLLIKLSPFDQVFPISIRFFVNLTLLLFDSEVGLPCKTENELKIKTKQSQTAKM